jgi:hypothetical protein
MAAPKKLDFTARLAQIESELDAQRKLTDHYREELAAQREAAGDDGFIDAVEPNILYDPYTAKNPFKVIGEIVPDDEYPEGAIVAWKSPAYRERRQWRGWKPFSYGDRYTGKTGEMLSQYIPDPPPMLAASGQLDNYVRRGDVVLSRLDKRIFQSRQEQRLLDSRERQGMAGSSRKTVLGDGIELVGTGVQRSKRPRGGFRPAPESE